VFAALTPHRQLLAQKWASPFFGFAHPPPFRWWTVRANTTENNVENCVQFDRVEISKQLENMFL